MRNSVLTLLLCVGLEYVQAQVEPSSAPAVNPFNLKPDNLGAIANSVNLFTGDLNLPLNLVSIPGNGGLGIEVSIGYSSTNVENIVGTWNLEAPTGVLGLGWSLSYPMILADNKLTGSREDDEFYLLEGGASNKLICIGSSGGAKSYKTKTYTNWIITFTPTSERWEITREDGSKYTYGDQSSSRNTVQWTIKWNNWIGNSNISSSQRQGLAWNLSEVKNIWGEKLTYTYINDENFVGAGSTNHTESSYLSKITDLWGHEAELIYKNKLPNEYQDPHTELAEPDAFQERYEKRFLDKIVVRTDGEAFYEVQCKYVTDLLGSGSLTKRLLKSIIKVSTAGSQATPIFFEYLSSGAMKGALSDVRYGAGGSVSFDYEDENGLVIEYSERAKGINPPSYFVEPKVVIENDFVATVWRQWDGSNHDVNQRPIRVITNTWNGGWKEEDLGVIASVKLIDATNVIPDYIIRSGPNCFAILVPTYVTNKHNLYLWYKDEEMPGKWRSGRFNDLVIDDPNKKDIIVGDKYVAVVGNTTSIYTFNFGGVTWSSNTISFTAGDRYYGGGVNYLWVHNVTPNPDAITFYHLDEARNWVSSPTTFNAPFNAGSGFNNWYNTNSTAIGMITGGPEYLFTWNESYTSFTPLSTTQQYSDNSFIKVYNDKIHITDDANKKQQVFHFNGASWVASGDETIRSTSYTYNSLPLPVLNLSRSEESFAWTKTGVSGLAFLRRFDINTSQWLAETSFPSSNGITPDMGVNYIRIHNDIYYRSPSSTTPSLVGSLTPSFQGFEGKFALNYLIYKPTYPGGGTYIQYLKNGLLFNSAQEIHPVMSISYHLKSSWLGNNTFVVATANGLPQDKTGLYLYRSANYAHEGKLKDYPVIKVTINDGKGVQNNTSYSYDATKATLDPSSIFARYNKVSTFPGTATISSKPFGYTETYFFNGLSENELAETFPSDGAKGNAPHYYNILTGQSYRTKVFSSTSTTPIAETNTMWYVGSKTITNNAGTPITLENSFFIRAYRLSEIKDGIEAETSYDFDSYAHVNYQRNVTRLAGIEKEVIEAEYTYAWQSYPSLVTKNILSPIVQTKKRVNNTTYTESASTRWKDWPCTGPDCIYSTVPAPVDQYAWKGTNTSTFSWWDVATQNPSSDWSFAGKIVARDAASGSELEQQSNGNQLSCKLLNQNKRNVLATIFNTGLSKVAHASFEVLEDATTGNWSSWGDGVVASGSSKTGDRYLALGTTGLTKTGLVTTDRYTISFWAKSANGAVVVDGVGTINLGNISEWTLFEYTVSGLSSFNIRRSGTTAVQIDEIRFLPATARMSTSTHHPLFGVTSSTNANNQTIFTEFDDLGRVKNLLDQNRNIIQTNVYNFKK